MKTNVGFRESQLRKQNVSGCQGGMSA
jgi:hypothetical protein